MRVNKVSFGSHGFLNNQVLVINPKMDASERQIKLLNNFKSTHTALEEMLVSGETEFKYFKPEHPGIFDFEQKYRIKQIQNKRLAQKEEQRKRLRMDEDSFVMSVEGRKPQKRTMTPESEKFARVIVSENKAPVSVNGEPLPQANFEGTLLKPAEGSYI